MPDRALTILQLTHQGGGSGSTTIIANVSRQLARRGPGVLVGCRPGTMLAQLAWAAGLEVVALDFHRLGPLADALRETIAREEVDVVNSNATRDRRALTWLRLRRRLSLPFVVTRHTMPLTLPPELIVVGLSADRTVAVSHAVARALRRRLHPGARLRVVPNGIDCERIDTPPSEAELAAVVAAAGGSPDAIPSGKPGVLVPPIDPRAWADALARVLGDRAFAQRIARAGRDLVRREFSLERTAERTEAVYREAVERRRALGAGGAPPPPSPPHSRRSAAGARA